MVPTGCGGCEETASEPRRVATPPAAEPPRSADEPADEPVVVVKKAPAAPGFSFVDIEDRVPLCVFSDHQEWFETKHRHDARPQKLKAGHSVVLGAFSPWCVHESCDQRPSMQCQVTREGTTMVVHSRFWGEHKDGARCTKDCKSMTASCETPALEAGTYSVQHGSESFAFEVPGTLREPCFGKEHEPPGSAAATTAEVTAPAQAAQPPATTKAP
jgi:hypothetical protein